MISTEYHGNQLTLENQMEQTSNKNSQLTCCLFHITLNIHSGFYSLNCPFSWWIDTQLWLTWVLHRSFQVTVIKIHVEAI